MALPCFDVYNNGTGDRYNQPNAQACTAIENGKANGPSIASYFGGYEVPNWGQCMANITGCTLSGFLPVDPLSPLLTTCDQGSVPSYYLNSPDPSHMYAVMQFAHVHQIPLIVKNTGHDHRGRSSSPYSLAIWTHNIQPDLDFSQNFIPAGCASGAGSALSYGAGYEFGQLYDAVHAQGYMITGGASVSVGASDGYVTGGGHGALTNVYGLAVDNVLQMKVLIANGTFLAANRCQNQDLFFAMRGGGGGTFGIVLNTTSRIYREVPMQMAASTFGHIGTESGSTFLQVIIDNAEKWAAEGWGGYILPGLLLGTVGNFAAITPNLTLEEAKRSMQPIIEFATSLTNTTVPVRINITTWPNGFYDFLQTSDAQTVGGFTGLSYALVSRLVPRSSFNSTSAKAQLLNVLQQMNANKEPNPIVPFYILMTTPAAYPLPSSDQAGGPGQASVTPAWRDALWQFEMPAIWDPQDPTALLAGSTAKAFANAHNAINPLRAITPNSRAYLNEADIFEPNAPLAFWGQQNYDRLLQIKSSIDPDNFSTCWNCIGWDSSDARYSCYPPDLS